MRRGRTVLWFRWSLQKTFSQVSKFPAGSRVKRMPAVRRTTARNPTIAVKPQSARAAWVGNAAAIGMFT